MYRYKNVLVGLGADQHDPSLIRYAGLVARMAQSERVTFAHVAQAAVPELVPHGDSVPASGEGYAAEELKQLRADLEKTVQESFEKPPGVHVQTELHGGAVLDEMLALTRSLETDLVLVGQGTHDGAFAEKLARKAPCSVLVVPTEAAPAIQRVLVPVDFSEHAADAVDVAVAFADAAGLGEVHLLHVYGAPTKGKRSHENATYALRRRAEEAYETFTADLDFRGLKPIPHFAIGLDVPEAVGRAARQHEADLVVVGARGRTPGAAILMGSTAEALIQHIDVPLVAVKQKGVTLKLLDVLLERSAG